MSMHSYVELPRELISLDKLHDVVFAIKQLNLDKLEDLFQQISDPTSSLYRNYLTRAEINEISVHVLAEENLIMFLSKVEGINIVKKSKYGEYILARAPISIWENTLSTEFRVFEAYIHGEKKRVVRARECEIPYELEKYVSYIFHTSQLPAVTRKNPAIQRKTDIADVNLNVHDAKLPEYYQFINPSKLNKLYEIPSNIGSAHASQAVFETIGQYFSPSDLRTFQELFELPRDTLHDYVGRNRLSDSLCVNSPMDCAEANLDLQYLMSVSQNASTTLWYTDESDDVFVEWILAVADLENPPLVHSISFGAYEDALAPSILTAFNVEAMKLGLQGVTIVVASGDDGVGGFLVRYTDKLCGYFPSFPASSPFVVSVGGTMGPEAGRVEVTCQSDGGGVITSGGGFSRAFHQPTWQKEAIKRYFSTLPTVFHPVAGFDLHGRGFPDISLVAHNYAVVVGGEVYLMSGTSASAPVVAGMLSLINSELLSLGRPPLGFINPTLYADGGRFANDIVIGDNRCSAIFCCEEGFFTTEGWDPVTGFGSVNFMRLRKLLTDRNPSTRQGYNNSISTLRSENSYLLEPSGNGNGNGNGGHMSPRDALSIGIIVLLLLIAAMVLGFLSSLFCSLRLQALGYQPITEKTVSSPSASSNSSSASSVGGRIKKEERRQFATT